MKEVTIKQTYFQGRKSVEVERTGRVVKVDGEKFLKSGTIMFPIHPEVKTVK